MLDVKTIDTRFTTVRYLEAGGGDPLVFLHGTFGVGADDPLLRQLAERFHVFAPYLPGYGETEDCADLRDMLDFTLHGWDVVAALGIRDPLLVGHCMGGMIAAEMAAIAPNDVTRLALIAPAGLWMEAHPSPDLFTLLPYQMPQYLYHDPANGAALMTTARRIDDPQFLETYLIRNARQLGMAGKLLFPIPERGLAQRLYRIKAETVIVWGESDRLTPPIHGAVFQAAIEGSRLVSVPQAGHMVTQEKPHAVSAAIATLV